MALMTCFAHYTTRQIVYKYVLAYTTEKPGGEVWINEAKHENKSVTRKLHSMHRNHAQHAPLASQSAPAIAAPFVVSTWSIGFVALEESTVG